MSLLSDVALLGAALDSPTGVHRALTLEHAFYATLARVGPRTSGQPADLAVHLEDAVASDPMMVLREDWWPSDPRLVVCTSPLAGRRWRVHPGRLPTPLDSLEATRDTCSSIDKLCRAKLGFAATDLLEVALRYQHAAVSQMAAAWPAGDRGGPVVNDDVQLDPLNFGDRVRATPCTVTTDEVTAARRWWARDRLAGAAAECTNAAAALRAVEWATAVAVQQGQVSEGPSGVLAFHAAGRRWAIPAALVVANVADCVARLADRVGDDTTDATLRDLTRFKAQRLLNAVTATVDDAGLVHRPPTGARTRAGNRGVADDRGGADTTGEQGAPTSEATLGAAATMASSERSFPHAVLLVGRRLVTIDVVPTSRATTAVEAVEAAHAAAMCRDVHDLAARGHLPQRSTLVPVRVLLTHGLLDTKVVHNGGFAALPLVGLRRLLRDADTRPGGRDLVWQFLEDLCYLPCGVDFVGPAAAEDLWTHWLRFGGLLPGTTRIEQHAVVQVVPTLHDPTWPMLADLDPAADLAHRAGLPPMAEFTSLEVDAPGRATAWDYGGEVVAVAAPSTVVLADATNRWTAFPVDAGLPIAMARGLRDALIDSGLATALAKPDGVYRLEVVLLDEDETVEPPSKSTADSANGRDDRSEREQPGPDCESRGTRSARDPSVDPEDLAGQYDRLPEGYERSLKLGRDVDGDWFLGLGPAVGVALMSAPELVHAHIGGLLGAPHADRPDVTAACRRWVTHTLPSVSLDPWARPAPRPGLGAWMEPSNASHTKAMWAMQRHLPDGQRLPSGVHTGADAARYAKTALMPAALNALRELARTFEGTALVLATVEAAETAHAERAHRRRQLRAGLNSPFADTVRRDALTGPNPALLTRPAELLVELVLADPAPSTGPIPDRFDIANLTALAHLALLAGVGGDLSARGMGGVTVVVDHGGGTWFQAHASGVATAGDDDLSSDPRDEPDGALAAAVEDGVGDSGHVEGPTDRQERQVLVGAWLEATRRHELANGPITQESDAWQALAEGVEAGFIDPLSDSTIPGNMRVLDSKMCAELGWGLRAMAAMLATASSLEGRYLPVLTREQLVATSLDYAQHTGVKADELGAFVDFLTLRGTDVRSNLDFWEQERRPHRLFLRPLVELPTGELAVPRYLVWALQEVTADMLAEGRLVWPKLPAEVEQAANRARAGATGHLERAAVAEVKATGSPYKDHVEPHVAARHAILDLPGEVDILVCDPERRVLWVIEVKHHFQSASPYSIKQRAERFHANRGHLAKLRHKTAVVADQATQAAAFVTGANVDSRGLWEVRPVMATARLEPAAFVIPPVTDVEFVLVDDLADHLRAGAAYGPGYPRVTDDKNVPPPTTL